MLRRRATALVGVGQLRALATKHVNEWARKNPDLQLPDGRQWIEELTKYQYDSLLEYPRRRSEETDDGVRNTSFTPTATATSPTADVDGIPIDVFHDLRTDPEPQKLFYPFAAYDLHASLDSGRARREKRPTTGGHQERIKKVTELLSHLSSSSNMQNVLTELSLEGKDFEDILYELEFAGRRSVALRALQSCPPELQKSLSHPFCEDFANVLIREKCRLSTLLEFLQILEGGGWSPSLSTVHHLAQLCLEQKDLDRAICFAKSSEGSLSDTLMFNRFIESSLAAGRRTLAFGLFEEMKKRGVRADAATFASLMKCCFHRLDNQAVFDLFTEMKTLQIRPDLYVYNLCIRSCEKMNDVEIALVLYEEMTERDGVAPNVKTYSLLVQLCGRNGRLERALEFVEGMRREGTHPNTTTMNHLLLGCLKSGEPKRAFVLFEKMREVDGTPPDAFTFSLLFRACAGVEDVSKILSLFHWMKEIGVCVDEVAYTAAIDAAGACGEGETAILLLREMLADGVKPNAVTRDALVRACAKTATQTVSSLLLHEIRRCGMELNAEAFHAILQACSDRGDVDAAQKWRSRMRESGVLEETKTFAILITAAGVANNVPLALQYFSEMQSAQLPYSVMPYRAILTVCLRCRAYEHGWEIFEETKAEKPDMYIFHLMLELAAASGRPNEGWAIFDEMLKRGLRPNNRTRQLTNALRI